MITDYIDRTANVYGIYGHLGGGKTLTAVEIMLWALRQKFSVTSNILLRNTDRLSFFNSSDYHFVEEFDNVDFWSLPVGAPRGSSSRFRSVIVVDECAEFFDQFSTQSPKVRDFLSWLRHSSKRGQYVFLIVQRPEFINKSLRNLINKWIICDDLEQVRIPVIRCRLPFCSPFVMRKVVDRWGNVISRGFNFGDKKVIGKFYDTSQSIALRGKDADFNYTDPSEDFTLRFLFLVFLYLLFCLLW